MCECRTYEALVIYYYRRNEGEIHFHGNVCVIVPVLVIKKKRTGEEKRKWHDIVCETSIQSDGDFGSAQRRKNTHQIHLSFDSIRSSAAQTEPLINSWAQRKQMDAKEKKVICAQAKIKKIERERKKK